MQLMIIISGMVLEFIVILSLLLSPLYSKKVKWFFIWFSAVRLIWTMMLLSGIYESGSGSIYVAEVERHSLAMSFFRMERYPPLFIGPLYFIYFGSVFGFFKNEERFNNRHFIIPFFMLIAIIELSFFSVFSTGYLESLIIRLFKAVFLLYIFFYYCLTAYYLLKVNLNWKERAAVVILSGAYSLTIVVFVARHLITDSGMTNNFLLTLLAYDTLIYFLNILLMQRFPLLLGMNSVIRKAAADKSIESNLISDIKKRFEMLFNVEKIHRLEDLTLNMLAAELGVQPYQLSYYLNKHIGRSFFTVVNSYRIDDAKFLLVNSPAKTIITIAFETGFNSKSSFNRIFHRQTGMTPTEYRAKYSVVITPNL